METRLVSQFGKWKTERNEEKVSDFQIKNRISFSIPRMNKDSGREREMEKKRRLFWLKFGDRDSR